MLHAGRQHSDRRGGAPLDLLRKWWVHLQTASSMRSAATKGRRGTRLVM
jgi:hypothetical protein